MSGTFDVVVHSVTFETSGIDSFDLRPRDGMTLPPFSLADTLVIEL